MRRYVWTGISLIALMGCNNGGSKSGIKGRNQLPRNAGEGDRCGGNALRLDEEEEGHDHGESEECEVTQPSPTRSPSPSPTPPRTNSGTNSNTSTVTTTSTSTSTSTDTVTFRIKSGTGQGPWNTEADMVKVKVGQKLEIINDDSTPHRLHTPGAPCPHQPGNINQGEKFVCEITRAVDLQPGDRPRTYDHNAGRNSFFYLKAEP